MKTTILLSLLLVSATGCLTSKYHTEWVTQNGVKVATDWKGTSLFANSALKGLTVGTNNLKITGVTTEPNSESITASGAALGELIGTAAKAAAK